MDEKKHYRLDGELFDYFNVEGMEVSERRRNQFLINLCHTRKGQSLLDIGSGRGWFALAKQATGIHCTCNDISDVNLQRIQDINKDIEILCNTIYEIPETKQYDWIVMNEVLEHIERPAEAIRKVVKLLKPSGRLLVTVPHNEKIVQELCIHCHQKTPRNAHLHSFTSDDLRQLLVSEGLLPLKTAVFFNPLLAKFGLFKLTKALSQPLWCMLDQLLFRIYNKSGYLAMIAMRPKESIDE